jgi:hypothetical protein
MKHPIPHRSLRADDEAGLERFKIIDQHRIGNPIGVKHHSCQSLTTIVRLAEHDANDEAHLGVARRECLDHVVVFGEAHRRRVRKTYAAYYNDLRTHVSLNKVAPSFRRSQTVGSIIATPILGGLHHEYVRV